MDAIIRVNTDMLGIDILERIKKMFPHKTIDIILHPTDENFEQQIVMDIPVRYFKNDYLESFNDFWKVEALFKKEEIKRALHSSNGEISNAFIESIFTGGKLNFYIDKDKKHLFAYVSPAFNHKYGVLNQLDALTALKLYGIDKLEETSEKGYSKI
jgi:hypothetical protein